MHSSVEDNPRDQKTGKGRHEPFLQQLPNSSILFFIDLLEFQAININDCTVNSSKPKIWIHLFSDSGRNQIGSSLQSDGDESLQWNDSPNDAKQDSDNLARPVDYI